MLKVIKCRDLLFIISRKEGAQEVDPPSPPPVEKSRRPYLPEAPLLDDSDHAFLDEFGGLPEDEAALTRLIVECKQKEEEYLKKNQDKLQKLRKIYPGMSQRDLEELLLAFMDEPQISATDLS